MDHIDHNSGIHHQGRRVGADRGGIAVGDHVLGNINVQNFFHAGKPLEEYEQLYRQSVLNSTPIHMWSEKSYIELDVREKGVPVGKRLDDRIPLIITELLGRVKSKATTVADLIDIEKGQSTIREALNSYKRAFLLGDPGSGKTTTLKWFASELASDTYKGEIALPVYLDLGLYKENVDFITWLRTQLFQWPGGEIIASPEYLPTYLYSGKLVLLLDALNEIPEKIFEERLDSLAKFLDRFKPTYCIISCRVFDYRRIKFNETFGNTSKPSKEVTKLGAWSQLVIEPLSQTQIKDYLISYLGKEEGVTLFNSIWQSHTKWWEPETTEFTVKELTTNPFFLAVIVAVYKDAQGLPKRVNDILDKFVEILLAREMGTDWPKTRDGLAFRTALEKLAYHIIHEGDQGTSFPEDEAIRLISKHNIDSYPVLYLAVASNILIYENKGLTVRFSHQIMQEFFASREYGRRVAAGNIPKMRSAWQEVPIIYASSLEDASEFIDRLMKEDASLASRCYAIGGAQINPICKSNLIKAFLQDNVSNRRPALFKKYFGECAIPVLIEALKTEVSSAYNVVIDALEYMGMSAIKPLIELHMYEFTPIYARDRATLALTRLKAEDALIAYLPNADVEGRRQVAWAFGWIGGNKSIHGLRELTNDSETVVRTEAARGFVSAEAWKELIKLAHHSDSDVRYEVAAYLGKLAGKEGLPILMDLLMHDSSPFVRSAAARSVKHTETKDLEIVYELARGLNDPNNDVSFEVQCTLYHINIPESLKILKEYYEYR